MTTVQTQHAIESSLARDLVLDTCDMLISQQAGKLDSKLNAQLNAALGEVMQAHDQFMSGLITFQELSCFCLGSV